MKKYLAAITYSVSCFICTINLAYAQVVSAAPVSELCPRGTYELKSMTDKQNLLLARVTLPTLGYKLQLKLRPEKISPPLVDFLCIKPTGIVAQVITSYDTPLITTLNKVTIVDSVGRTTVALNMIEQRCAAGQYFDTSPLCGLGTTGKCMTKPEICTKEFNPVVGCDGKTYPNKCSASAAGVSTDGAWSYQAK